MESGRLLVGEILRLNENEMNHVKACGFTFSIFLFLANGESPHKS